MSEAEFTALVIAGQPDAPQYFVYDAIMNRRERQTPDDSLQPSLKPLAPADLIQQQEGKALDDMQSSRARDAA